MKRKIGYVFLGLISLIYIINPTAGLLELIPDNAPFIGNLDEFAASALLIKAIRVVFGKEDQEKKNDSDSIDENLIKVD